MKPATTLFYDVDTQKDFMLPTGKLYVPGAERILPQLQELTALARRLGMRIAGSVDRHGPADLELLANGGEYPEHCMNGTDGQKKVDVTIPQQPRWVENRDYAEAELQSLLAGKREVYLEKQRFNVFEGNRNAVRVFDRLLQGVEDVVVYGVVTEVCVDQAVSGLKDRSVQLHVPLDAIAAFSEERGNETLEKWRRWGIRLTAVAAVAEALGRET